MVGYRQTNQKTDTGKTLTRWPVFVDHFSGAGAGIHARRVTASGGSTSHLRRIHMSGCRFMVVPGNLEESHFILITLTEKCTGEMARLTTAQP